MMNIKANIQITSVVIAFMMTAVNAHATRQTPITPNPVMIWNEAMLEAVRRTSPGPVRTSRALAIGHTCMFDAWAAYDSIAVGTQFGGALRQSPTQRSMQNKVTAVHYAAYLAAVDLFPTQKSLFDSVLALAGLNANTTQLDRTTPVGVANTACQAVLNFRHNDGSNQLGDLNGGTAYSDYTNYQPVNTSDRIVDANHWQPLAIPNVQGVVTIQKFLAPHWFKVKPFAMSSSRQFRPTAPYRAGTLAYKLQVDHVLALSATLTDRQKMVAEYWEVGPKVEFPPGHWALLAQHVSRRDHHTIDQDVKMFFGLGNALLDAGIAAWDAKRAYDYVRPITAVHYLYNGKPILAWAGAGQGTRWIRGQDWRPYQPTNVVTPPFSEHVSGHSTFSAAAAAVLRNFKGSDYLGFSVDFPVGSSRVEPNITPKHKVTLNYPTFTAAANDAGVSRLYGGIHFVKGDQNGRAMGFLIGNQAWLKTKTYINGTAR